jgi:hypothetical protein
MAKYNGWTNWETWKANLELFDDVVPQDLDEEILECYNKGKWSKDDLMAVSDAFAEILERGAVDMYNEIEDPFLASLFDSFIAEVNFEEIAENKIDDYKESLI